MQQQYLDAAEYVCQACQLESVSWLKYHEHNKRAKDGRVFPLLELSGDLPAGKAVDAKWWPVTAVV